MVAANEKLEAGFSIKTPSANPARIHLEVPSQDTVIAPGSMTPEQALKYAHSHKGKTVLSKNNQPVNSDPIIERTPGDTSSKYDKGYIAGNGESLEHYRKRNKQAAIKSDIDIVGEVLLIIGLGIALIFLIRLILRKWRIIKKFFMG